MTKSRPRSLRSTFRDLRFVQETPNGLRLAPEGINRLKRIWAHQLNAQLGDIDRIGLEQFSIAKRQYLVGLIRTEREGSVNTLNAMHRLLRFDIRTYRAQIHALQNKKDGIEKILNEKINQTNGKPLPILQSEVQRVVKRINDRQWELAQRAADLQPIMSELRAHTRALSVEKLTRPVREQEADRIIDEYIDRPEIVRRLGARAKANQRYRRIKHKLRDST